MASCPKCGKEIRYISVSPGAGVNGIIPVETREEEIITEKGRRVRGYKAHECAGNKACSRRGITPDICGGLLEDARGC
jgi:hypothetical protein